MFGSFEPKAFIFDFDGTLADSMWVWSEVDKEFARRRGLDFTKEDSEIIAALGFEGTAKWLLERFGLDESVDDLIAEWYAIAADSYAHDVPLKPGVREYLSHLKKRDYPLAIASSLDRRLLESALLNNGVLDWFDVIVVCDEVTETGKSTPVVYTEAATRLGFALSDCVVFEDVAMAARSAKAGGAFVVGVSDEHPQQSRDQLKQAADYFCEGFPSLLV